VDFLVNGLLGQPQPLSRIDLRKHLPDRRVVPEIAKRRVISARARTASKGERSPRDLDEKAPAWLLFASL
jgi:hypothetical protein